MLILGISKSFMVTVMKCVHVLFLKAVIVKTWILVQSVSQYTQMLTAKIRVKVAPPMIKCIQFFQLFTLKVEFSYNSGLNKKKWKAF